MILGIDPGSTETAYCLIQDDYTIESSAKLGNGEFLKALCQIPFTVAAIESIQSYGMAVGREVFDTCYMIGRIQQRIDDLRFCRYVMIPRPEYTRRLCGVAKVNDAILRRALLLRFGGDKKGGPLAKLKGCTDKRSAFAVAAYHLDTLRGSICPVPPAA